MGEEGMLDLLSELDAKKMLSVKAGFDLYDGEMNREEFVRVLLAHLEPTTGDGKERNEAETVRSLLQIFKVIDINDNGDVDWGEFQHYIQKIGLNEKLEEEDEGLETEYVPSEVVDPVRRHRGVDRVYYAEEIDRIFVLETSSKILKLYDKDFKNERTLTLRATILAMEYIPSRREVAISTVDNTVTVFDCSPSVLGYSFYQKCRLHSTCPQLNLAWNMTTSCLVTVGQDGFISKWKLDTLSDEQPLQKRWRGHDDMVTDVVDLSPDIEAFATCSLDGIVKVWNTRDERPSKIFKGHEKGVTGMTYSQKTQMLYSIGLDHEIYIWNPFMNGVVAALKGHISSIVGVGHVEGQSIMISVEVEGIVKIWDMKLFRCIQTLFPDPGQKKCSSLAVMSNHKRIVVSGKSCWMYKAVTKEQDPRKTSDIPLTAISFNNTSSQFMTVATNGQVKVWNADSGVTVKTWTPDQLEITSEVTAFCFSYDKRRFVLGCHNGEIKIYVSSTGEYLEDLTARDSEVMYTFMDKESKSVIAVSLDGIVRVHEMGALDGGDIARTFFNLPVTSADYSPYSRVIAVASVDNRVRLWDIENSTTPDAVIYDYTESITCVKFLEDLPLLLVCTADGRVNFHAVKPSRLKYDMLYGFDHKKYQSGRAKRSSRASSPVATPVSVRSPNRMDSISRLLSEETDSPGKKGDSGSAKDFTGLHAAVTCATFNRKSAVLYLGDDDGYISMFDLRGFLKKFLSFTIQDDNLFTYNDVTMKKLLIPGSDDWEDYEGNPAVLIESLGPDDVLFSYQWRAHAEDVGTLSLIQEPPIVYTCASDCTARLWKPNGDPFGTLCQNNHNYPQAWPFRVNFYSKRRISTAKVAVVMKGVRNLEEEEELEQEDLDEVWERPDQREERVGFYRDLSTVQALQSFPIIPNYKNRHKKKKPYVEKRDWMKEDVVGGDGEEKKGICHWWKTVMPPQTPAKPDTGTTIGTTPSWGIRFNHYEEDRKRSRRLQQSREANRPKSTPVVARKDSTQSEPGCGKSRPSTSPTKMLMMQRKKDLDGLRALGAFDDTDSDVDPGEGGCAGSDDEGRVRSSSVSRLPSRGSVGSWSTAKATRPPTRGSFGPRAVHSESDDDEEVGAELPRPKTSQSVAFEENRLERSESSPPMLFPLPNKDQSPKKPVRLTQRRRKPVSTVPLKLPPWRGSGAPVKPKAEANNLTFKQRKLEAETAKRHHYDPTMRPSTAAMRIGAQRAAAKLNRALEHVKHDMGEYSLHELQYSVQPEIENALLAEL